MTTTWLRWFSSSSEFTKWMSCTSTKLSKWHQMVRGKIIGNTSQS
jgi:hypothetical protein